MERNRVKLDGFRRTLFELIIRLRIGASQFVVFVVPWLGLRTRVHLVSVMRIDHHRRRRVGSLHRMSVIHRVRRIGYPLCSAKLRLASRECLPCAANDRMLSWLSQQIQPLRPTAKRGPRHPFPKVIHAMSHPAEMPPNRSHCWLAAARFLRPGAQHQCNMMHMHTIKANHQVKINKS